jgi:hypothetical protein
LVALVITRFVKDFSKIVCPLNNLLKGLENTPSKKTQQRKVTKQKSTTVDWRWTDTEKKAFQTIKEKLTSPPVLGYADYRNPFILHTDASLNGLSAVRYQEQGSTKRVIAYVSRCLQLSQKNYPAYKLEFLALKWAVCDKLHYYLYGNSFQVITDNNPLTYVMSKAK